MYLSCVASFLALVLVGVAEGGNPTEKVIKLVEDLKSTIESEGKKDAVAYEEFACLCKDTEKSKATAIRKNEKKITSLSADIGSTDASMKGKQAAIATRRASQQQMASDLKAAVERCTKAKADFEASNADTDKALASLEKAVNTMKGKKSSIDSQGKSVVKSLSLLQYTLSVADEMSLVAAEKRPAIAAFLQNGAVLDPSDPAYKYHAKEINEILDKLVTDFKAEKDAKEQIWKNTNQACEDEKSALATSMEDNLAAIGAAKEEEAAFAKELSELKGSLVSTEDELQTDAKALKASTTQCEAKAVAFDKRAKTRNDMVGAFAKVLALMTDKPMVALKNSKAEPSSKVELALSQDTAAAPIARKALSFLQAAPARARTGLLAKESSLTSQRAQTERVISLLRVEADRLHSISLAMLNMNIAQERFKGGKDHFKVVKEAIQKVIDGKLAKAAAEKKQEEYCAYQTKFSKNNHDRATRKANNINASIALLTSKKEELQDEIKLLAGELDVARDDLNMTTVLRKAESKKNAQTIAETQDGLKAVEEAKTIIAPRVETLAKDKLVKSDSTVKEAVGAGGSTSVVALMDEIVTDLKKTVSDTESAEDEAERDFQKVSSTAKAEIKGKEVKTELDTQDLKATNTKLESAGDDLKTQVGLVEDTAKLLADMKAQCNKKYAEMQATREKEIAALNKAMAVLTDGVKKTVKILK